MGKLLLLALSVGLAIILNFTDLENVVYQKSEKVYDLKTLTAPILHGTALRVFANIVENRLLGSVIIPHLLKENQFPDVVGFADTLNEAPLYYPLVPPEASVVERAKDSPFDLESFSQELNASPRQPGEGFRHWSIEDYASAYRSKKTTPTAVIQTLLKLVAKSDEHVPPLRAFIHIEEQDALKQAEESTKRFEAGVPLSILDGVPIAVKDEVDVRGYVTTAGSGFLKSPIAEKDATIVSRLREKGAIILGKANMHEFGMGTTGLNPHHGTPRNPFNLKHHTGGSSSGSAAAVASGLVPLAIAADGGGSIRIPSSFCGVHGIKPTFGRVSEVGAFPLCWSLAHLGPMANSARDLALAYGVMAGKDSADHNSLVQPNVDLKSFWKVSDLKGVRIGVFQSHFEDASAPVVQACQKAVDFLKSKGAEIVPIEMPNLAAVAKSHAITILSEMSASLHKFSKENRVNFGLDVIINTNLAKYFSSVYYISAQKIRSYYLKQVKSIYEKVDVIASPTTADVAPFIVNGSIPDGISDVEMTTKIMRYAVVANFVGLPAISVPVGQEKTTNLPIGLQLMGNFWDEALLLRLAHVLETNHLTNLKKPEAYYSPL